MKCAKAWRNTVEWFSKLHFSGSGSDFVTDSLTGQRGLVAKMSHHPEYEISFVIGLMRIWLIARRDGNPVVHWLYVTEWLIVKYPIICHHPYNKEISHSNVQRVTGCSDMPPITFQKTFSWKIFAAFYRQTIFPVSTLSRFSLFKSSSCRASAIEVTSMPKIFVQHQLSKLFI